ncbi:MAG: thiamine phosphate synthase [Eubacteriales bacterium]|nr:thiamine phosphate synthase [Eubacteriales bacterium]
MSDLPLLPAMPSLQSYENFIAVTDRSLSRRDFLAQIEVIASLHPCALILREKDLPGEDYQDLAVRVQEICRAKDVPFFVHGRIDTARAIGCRCLHLPLPALRALGRRPAGFDLVSTSCHSMEDMREAVSLGADRIILGTIFETQCKKGLRGKGLAFLREICAASPVPVYAIGGIKEDTLDAVMASGAAGACMMSGFMIK